MVEIISLVERMRPHVAELAARVRAGVPLDAIVMVLADVDTELGKMFEMPDGTTDGISMYAAVLPVVVGIVRELDENVARSMADVPAAGEVRVLAVAGGALALFHVPVATVASA